MINKDMHRYCTDYTAIENYDKAIADETNLWVVHHRIETPHYRYGSDGKTGTYISKETLIKAGLYWKRPACELILLPRDQHMKIHLQDQNYRSKLSDSNKGLKRDDATRARMSAGIKLAHKNPHTKARHSEAMIGMVFWNNGSRQIRSRECPGEGWKRGCL